MRRVIIESPYAGDVETHKTYARRCIRDSLQRGEAPIASHLLYTQPGVLDDNIPEEREQRISAGLAWIDVAHAVVFYRDYGVSKGMAGALDAAMTQRKNGYLNLQPFLDIEERTIGRNPT